MGKQWVAVMGRWLPSALKSAQPTRPEPVKRYPPVGGEGSKLWEESRSVLQGTTNFPNDPDSPHLLPMDGYLAKGKSHAGFPRPGMKVAACGKHFCRKVAGYGVPHSSYDCEFSFYICRLAEIVQAGTRTLLRGAKGIKSALNKVTLSGHYDAAQARKQRLRQTGFTVSDTRASDLLRKAVQAIHIAPKSGKIGLQQRKMFSSLIRTRFDRRRSSQAGRASRFRLRRFRTSGLNSNNTKYVKDTVNSLISTVVNWDYLAADRSTVWKASGLLAGAGSAIGAEVQLLRPDSQRVAQPRDLRTDRYADRPRVPAVALARVVGKHGALRGSASPRRSRCRNFVTSFSWTRRRSRTRNTSCSRARSVHSGGERSFGSHARVDRTQVRPERGGGSVQGDAQAEHRYGGGWRRQERSAGRGGRQVRHPALGSAPADHAIWRAAHQGGDCLYAQSDYEEECGPGRQRGRVFPEALTHGYTLSDGQGTEAAAPARIRAEQAGTDSRQISGGEGRGSRRVFPRTGDRRPDQADRALQRDGGRLEGPDAVAEEGEQARADQLLPMARAGYVGRTDLGRLAGIPAEKQSRRQLNEGLAAGCASRAGRRRPASRCTADASLLRALLLRGGRQFGNVRVDDGLELVGERFLVRCVDALELRSRRPSGWVFNWPIARDSSAKSWRTL